MPPRKQADKEEAQALETNKDHVENAKELEQKAREEGDVNSRQESDARQRGAEKDDDFQPKGGDDKDDEREGAKDPEEVFEDNKQASLETEPEETNLVEEALGMRDETLERSKKPFDTSNFIAQRAVFDTSGNAGVADQDMRRAYPAYDLDALYRQDVPAHLAKYIVSDEGLPAVLEREEEARKDAPSTKKGKKS